MTTPLKPLLESLIPQEHAWKLKLFSQWHEVLGGLSTKASIEKIEGSIIWISVKHSAVGQELMMLSDFILERINAVIKPHVIKTIRFKVKNISQQQAKQPQKRRLDIKEHPTLTSEEAKLLAVIENDDLQSSIARYFRRCKSMRSLKDEKTG